MRLIFIIWLAIILHAGFQFIGCRGDIGGALGNSIGFASVPLGVFYGGRWACRMLGRLRCKDRFVLASCKAGELLRRKP